MFKKSFVTVGVLCAVLAFSGCAPEAPDPNAPVYTDENVAQMNEDIETTICSVAGKRVLTEEDVASFYQLSEDLRTYEGERKDAAEQVADLLANIAMSWDATLGTDLGDQNSETLTDLCESVKDLTNANS